MKTFHHVVEIDENTRKLSIYRVFEGGERQFYTGIDLPDPKSGQKGAIDELARLLGENLLLDSPTARKLLNL